MIKVLLGVWGLSGGLVLGTKSGGVDVGVGGKGR